jgi:hypothetical protein
MDDTYGNIPSFFESNKKIIIIGGGLIGVLVIILLVSVLLTRKSSTTQQTPGSGESSTTSGSSGNNGTSAQPGGNRSTTPATTQSTGEKIINKMDYAEAIKQVSNWLEKQKSSDGRYYSGYICTAKYTCDTPQVSNRDGVFVMWAKYKSYAKFKKQSDLNSLIQDLNVHTNSSIVTTLQNDFWNCRLMYDLIESTILPPDVQKKAKTVCITSNYNPPEEMANPNFQLDKLTEETILKGIDQILSRKQVLLVDNTQETTIDPISTYASAASDNAHNYLRNKNDNSYKQFAILYFQKALNSYLKDKKTNYQTPILAITAVDFYKMTGNQKYLDFAKHMFNLQTQKPCDSIKECVAVAFLSDDLYKVTKERNYVDHKKKTINRAVRDFYDGPTYPGYTFGHEVFYLGGQNALYPVRENALMVGLLIETE